MLNRFKLEYYVYIFRFGEARLNRLQLVDYIQKRVQNRRDFVVVLKLIRK